MSGRFSWVPLVVALSLLVSQNCGKNPELQTETQGTPDLEVANVPKTVPPPPPIEQDPDIEEPITTKQTHWKRIFLCVNQKNKKDDFTWECQGTKIRERLATGIYDIVLFTTVLSNPHVFPWGGEGMAYNRKGQKAEVPNMEAAVDADSVLLMHSYYGGHSDYLNVNPSLSNLRAMNKKFPKLLDVRHTHNSCRSYREIDRDTVERALKLISGTDKTLVLCGNQLTSSWGCACACGDENMGDQTLLCTAAVGPAISSHAKRGNNYSKYVGTNCIGDPEHDYYLNTWLITEGKGPNGENCLVCGYDPGTSNASDKNKMLWVDAAAYGQTCNGRPKPSVYKW